MISRKKKVAKRVVKRAIVRKNPDSGLRLKEDLIAFIKHKKKSADASTSSFLDDLLIQIEDVSPYHIDDLIIDFVIKENISASIYFFFSGFDHISL